MEPAKEVSHDKVRPTQAELSRSGGDDSDGTAETDVGFQLKLNWLEFNDHLCSCRLVVHVIKKDLQARNVDFLRIVGARLSVEIPKA
jgi:hypothetical protein